MKALPLHGEHLQEFRKALLWWYSMHARDLPWRRTRDPYKIWVSEIMLQQTRVSTMLGVYRSFVASYPSIPALALASEDEILARWSGLGYYKRARSLHEAARLLMRNYQGMMPQSFLELRKLPGVGDYTAAAVASIAFDEPVAVVDGNVERVITRLIGAATINAKTRHRIQDAAQKLLEPKQAGTFNQAMMELGAMVCSPRQPACDKCPVREFCRTQGEHDPAEGPKTRRVTIAYQVLRRNKKNPPQILFIRRPADSSQMPGMWELPLADPTLVHRQHPVWRTHHSITRTQYAVSVYDAGVAGDELQAEGREICWANSIAMQDLPLTGVTRKIMMHLRLMPRPLDGTADMQPEDLLPEPRPVPYGPASPPHGRRRNVADEDAVGE